MSEERDRLGDEEEREEVGVVTLVGAGPGDPDLITVAGKVALQEAEVVLYDELASPALLDLVGPQAERINVGKRGHEPPMLAQGDTNQLIVEQALRGKRVVRLKGGDPFVFGRGGEEASACRAAGVRFQVVPGVSSAIAALTYAGIPITDRRHAASFAVVTGHNDPTRVSANTRWAALGRAADTLVILMGMRNLPDIVHKLMRGGKAPDTPAAAVMHGSLPDQRVVEAPLAELPARVREAGLGAPSVVVVGPVVELRKELAWIEERPLHGLRVLVTRPPDQAREMVEAIRRAGGEPVLRPMIALSPPDDRGPLDAAIAALDTYDAIVFTSIQAVGFFADRVRALGSEDQLAGKRVLCVGPRTARAFFDTGLTAALVTTGAGGAEALLAELEAVLPLSEMRFLVPRSEIGRDVLPNGLRAAGAEVEEVVAYRNVSPKLDDATLCDDLVQGRLHCLTFTSPSTAEHFVARLDEPARAAMARCVRVAIGPTTAQALRDLGFEASVVPERPEGPALVAALARHVRSLGGPDAVRRRGGGA